MKTYLQMQGWTQLQANFCGSSTLNRGVFSPQARGFGGSGAAADSEQAVPRGTAGSLQREQLGGTRRDDAAGHPGSLAGCGDKIFLQGLEFHSFHGCLPEARLHCFY